MERTDDQPPGDAGEHIPNASPDKPLDREWEIHSNIEETTGQVSSEETTDRPNYAAPKSGPHSLPQAFGRYRIEQELGRGAMGVVYRAYDTQLDRQLALKVPFFSESDGADVVSRFFREARAMATIEHPNLCPVYDVGEIDGVHYLAMSLIEGRPISDYLKEGKTLPTRQVVSVIHKLALALHEAHEANVVHRDLKPANIMMNHRNEPVIMDFGLARRQRETEAELTQTGAILGSPAYMSPEQVRGEQDDIGPATDVYALGVILYQLTCGRLPFEGSVGTVFTKILTEEPISPRAIQGEFDPKLEAICLKAMAKLLEDRYQSAAELAEDLAGYLKADEVQQPLTAETISPASRGQTLQVGHAAGTQGSHDRSGEGTDPADIDASVREHDSQTATGRADGMLMQSGEGYRLVDRLGEGQYGEVWRGMAPGGVEVAVKKILFPLGHRATQVELNALELMKRLRHSYLLQVQAYWIMEEHLVIVMELADGSLEDRVVECRQDHDGGIPRDELFRYMLEAAEAIDYLHEQGVVHRDIKPANILLVQGHVKVGDFGIATSGILDQGELTTATATLGTPLYMAPELWDKQVGPRSDQYSLAVSYVELREGAEPNFAAEDQVNLSALPEKEQSVLHKALAKDPRDRFETCMQFAQALEAVAQRERREIVTRQRRKWAAVLTGVLLLLAVPVGWWLSSHPFWLEPPSVSAPEKMELRAGGTPVKFNPTTTGNWGESEVDLTFENVPPDVRISHPPSVETGAEVTVAADLQSEPRIVEITLVATADDNKVSRKITLEIAKAAYSIPPGYRPVSGTQLKKVDDGTFYEEIECILTGRPSVKFKLVQRTDKIDLATFYCMEDKVSNRLFAAFAKANPDKIKLGSQWSPVAGDQLPAFQVHAQEAHACAVWLGGRLPTKTQWDKAAGLFDHDDKTPEGPYQGRWGKKAPGALDIAVANADDAFARPVGEALDDVSHFGCRDMAANGRELTCTVLGSQKTLSQRKPQDDDLVVVRGCSYFREEPLRYTELEAEFPDSVEYNKTMLEDLSFRCVLELSGGRMHPQESSQR